MFKTDVQNPMHSPEARANRLKEARKFGRLSLREMTENGLINYNTLCGWESGKHGGLTEKGAQKIVERLRASGVNCSIEWLLYNIGQKPASIHPVIMTHKLTSIKDFIQKQIEIFKQIYPDFIGTMVEDAAMEPNYNIGDFVSGMTLPKEKIRLANGKDVIVQLEDGSKIIRKLVINTKKNSPSLIAVNSSYPDPILQDIDVIQWALVLCHLKYESLYD